MALRLDPKRFAAWIWFGGDAHSLTRLHDKAEKHASAIGLTDLGPAYARTKDDLANGFNEKSHHDWIESVTDDSDKIILGRILQTMRLSLGIQHFEDNDVDSDIEFIDPGGSGLKGSIYKCRQKSLDRIVAVKFIRAEFGGDALEHAKNMARIGAHPNVVYIHYLAKLIDPNDGQTKNAMVMEWLEGAQLASHLSGKRFEENDAKKICMGIVSGLKHIHDSGVPHSDLHPGNVMILDDFTPKIIDADEDLYSSFARMSSGSVVEAVSADIDRCRYNVFNICIHSNIPLSRVMAREGQLDSANQLEEIKEALNGIFDNSKPFLREDESRPTQDAKLIREQFENRVRAGNFWNLTKRVAAIAIGVIPIENALLEYEQIESVHLPTVFGRRGWSRKNRASAVASASGEGETCYSVTEMTTQGCILAADTWTLDPEFHRGYNELLIPSSATCSRIVQALTVYANILVELGRFGAGDLFVSLVDVDKYRLYVSESVQSQETSPVSDLLPQSVRINLQDKMEPIEVANKLKPVFDFIWREFGFQRCDKYVGDQYGERLLF